MCEIAVSSNAIDCKSDEAAQHLSMCAHSIFGMLMFFFPFLSSIYRMQNEKIML